MTQVSNRPLTGVMVLPRNWKTVDYLRTAILVPDRHERENLIDLVAVERAINGDPAPMTEPEQFYAAWLMDRLGYRTEAVIRLSGLDEKRVHRWREHGAPPYNPTARKRAA